MFWKAIPDTRLRDSETSVTECVVCAWNNTRSVGRRAQATSRPFRDQMYVVRQVRRRMTRQRREDKTCQFEVNSTLDRQCSYKLHGTGRQQLVLMPHVEKHCDKCKVFHLFFFRKFIRTLLREGNRHRARIIVFKVFVSCNVWQ